GQGCERARESGGAPEAPHQSRTRLSSNVDQPPRPLPAALSRRLMVPLTRTRPKGTPKAGAKRLERARAILAIPSADRGERCSGRSVVAVCVSGRAATSVLSGTSTSTSVREVESSTQVERESSQPRDLTARWGISAGSDEPLVEVKSLPGDAAPAEVLHHAAAPRRPEAGGAGGVVQQGVDALGERGGEG